MIKKSALNQLFLLAFLVGFLSCQENEKVRLTGSDLINKTVIERAEVPAAKYSGTETLWFASRNDYVREGNIYVQKKGHYELRNDTLEVHYDCASPCNKARCGIQRYVKRKGGKLHLVYLRDRDGNIEDLSETTFDKELEFKL